MYFRHAGVETDLPIKLKYYNKNSQACHDDSQKTSWHFGICTIAGIYFASLFSFMEAK